MGLKRLASKVVDYNERLKRGKASRIKPSHVKKVLGKLKKKAADLEDEIATEKRADKKVRLRKKLKIALEHVERAEWPLRGLGEK